jgi:tRNA (uracil-5-)-methyltransferase
MTGIAHFQVQNRFSKLFVRSVFTIRRGPAEARTRTWITRELDLNKVFKDLKMTKESRKRPAPNFQKPKKKLKSTNWPDCSKEDVLLKDIRELLETAALENHTETTPLEIKSELDVEIEKLSSTGEGLALHKASQSVLVVPFALPGDTVTVRPFRHVERESYYVADFLKVTSPSPQRDDSRINCQYFAKCSGCQFQMLSYEDQLAHKKTIVEKAFRNFSGLDPEQIPNVQNTMGSPLQYGYRTKLTPHFDGPPGGHRARKHGETPQWDTVPPIGFLLQGTRKNLDIEDCPIGTEAVRRGMKTERQRVADNIKSYRKGATLLLREDTKRVKKASMSQSEAEALQESEDVKHPVLEDRGEFFHLKSCITDQKATSTEYVDDFKFSNPAGSFFQNNNSILPPFIEYIRKQIASGSSSSNPVSYLVDAYCGSGLFTITLSSLFKKSIGIDIAPQSIAFAKRNVETNKSVSNATFMEGNAERIFKQINFPASETVVIIDPPRKGCDESFVSQLLQFGPQRIVYVSCNVHTQARDIGFFVRGNDPLDVDAVRDSYEIESLRGFDFFPQTGHVEGVAVLRKRAKTVKEHSTQKNSTT